MLDLYITAQRRFHLEAQPDEQPASAPTTATAAKILAQHHGVPTRSLDWTRNPLYAAYFAASEVESAQVDGKIAVWALQADMLKAQGYTPKHSASAYSRFIFRFGCPDQMFDFRDSQTDTSVL